MKNKYHKWEDCVSLQEIKSLMKFHHPNIIRSIISITIFKYQYMKLSSIMMNYILFSNKWNKIYIS